MKNYWFRKLKRKLGWYIKTNPVTRKYLKKQIGKKNALNYQSMLDYVETAWKVEVGKCDLRMGIV
ncbi:hypothetical protein EG832_08780, partial [bacterium]|nr:hypothetical protein [bacterium]